MVEQEISNLLAGVRFAYPAPIDIMSINSQPQRNIIGDPSLWLLLFSNLVTIFFATKEGWNLSTIMWIYWFQSIAIGFFNFIRILQLKEFSTERLKINGHPIQQIQGIKVFVTGTKIFTAFFFLVHYGLFHFSYLVFLLVDKFVGSPVGGAGFVDIKSVFLMALLFFISHLFSYLYNRPKDTKRQNIGVLMFYPYARIIPMHLTIIFGSYFANALPLFLILKTFSDVVMHVVEHRVIRKGEK